MKNIINKNKSWQKQSKFRLSDGTFTTDGQLISNTLNEFFIAIGLNLVKNYPRQKCPHSIPWVTLSSQDYTLIAKFMGSTWGPAGAGRILKCILW